MNTLRVHVCQILLAEHQTVGLNVQLTLNVPATNRVEIKDVLIHALDLAVHLPHVELSNTRQLACALRAIRVIRLLAVL